jgi:hypothetical protein
MNAVAHVAVAVVVAQEVATQEQEEYQEPQRLQSYRQGYAPPRCGAWPRERSYVADVYEELGDLLPKGISDEVR